MNTTEVFNNVYSQLVKSLPMKDAIFKAELKKEKLLFGNLEERVNSIATSADGATLFLNEAVEPFLHLEEEFNPFLKLLSVMNEFSLPLKQLATQIKNMMIKLKREVSSKEGL